jgi:hypothetical protein
VLGQIVVGAHDQFVTLLDLDWITAQGERGDGLPFLAADVRATTCTTIDGFGLADVLSVEVDLDVKSTVVTEGDVSDDWRRKGLLPGLLTHEG